MPRCLACGAENASAWATVWDAEYCTTTDRFTMCRCNACDTLFIDPVPLDRLAEIYPGNYYSFTPARQSPVDHIKNWLDRRTFRSVLGALPGTSLSVLDVGGGAGYQLNAVRAADSRVTFTQVVDFDDNAERLARASGHEYFHGRIEDFETERRFDLILLLNLIEHVHNPLEVLRHLEGMLAPNGRVLVKTPNWDSLDARIFRHRNWGGYHAPRHWAIFTRESLSSLATRAGLRVARFSYTQGAPFWTTSTLFWLAERGLVEISAERPAYYHPLYPPLAAAFAAFDFLRAPVSRLSQMFVELARADQG